MSTWRVLALLALGGCSNLNFAAAVRWNGFVDTDLAFSQFITGDHTVTFRFMPQYTMVGEAPVLSINGSGTYKVGIGDYRAGSSSAVKLLLQVGGAQAFYTQGNPTADGKTIPLKNKWHTVAVDWLPDHVTFWMDGKKSWTYTGPFVPKQAMMQLYLRNEMRNGFHRAASTPNRITMQVDWIRVYRAPAASR